MIRTLKQYPLAGLGLAFCLLIAAMAPLQIWIRGPGYEDLHTPLGTLISYLASLYMPAPSLVRAGTDVREEVAKLVLYGAALNAIAFGTLMWFALARRRHPRMLLALLALQVLLALAGDATLMYLVAGEVAILLPRRQGLWWMGAQSAAYLVVRVVFQLMPLDVSNDTYLAGMLALMADVSLGMIIYGLVRLVLRERRRRVQLGAANAELLATQTLLGESVRAAERLRIARDLHDIIGHHLTALTLHLDLALRQPPDKARAALETSRQLARGMLGEVREVVSATRDEPNLNLRLALQTLCDGIPVPRVALDYPAALEIASPLLAHTLFCCVQEAISNAVRHADAAHVTVALQHAAGCLHLRIADDGIAIAKVSEGNGLRGMRERLAEYGGRLNVEKRQARGFSLVISVPLAGGAADDGALFDGMRAGARGL